MKILYTILLILFVYNNLFPQNSKGYEYQAEGNEYKVTFSENPKITKSYSPDIGEIISAEYVNYKNNSFQRCETFLINENFKIDKDILYKWLITYAEHNGLSYPEYTYKENELGKIGTLKSFKDIEDSNGKKWKATIYEMAIFGSHSAIFLYVGCLSKDYPNYQNTKFLKSVGLNNEF